MKEGNGPVLALLLTLRLVGGRSGVEEEAVAEARRGAREKDGERCWVKDDCERSTIGSRMSDGVKRSLGCQKHGHLEGRRLIGLLIKIIFFSLICRQESLPRCNERQ